MSACSEYRKALLAEPTGSTPALNSHAATCRECAEFAQGVLRFEDRLQRALRIPVDAAAAPSFAPATEGALRRGRPWFQPVRRSGMALAASLLLAAGAATLWLSISGQSLAADVVGHMAGEPAAWARTEVPVPVDKLRNVLDASHVGLRPRTMLVSYASSCEFRGHRVPHLVVQTNAGPVTVMVLAAETVVKPVRFDENGYRGVIVPLAGHGSLAVLERGENVGMNTVEGVARTVTSALDWAQPRR